MWFSWTILSLVSVISNRYLKHYWRKRQLVHSIAGTVAGILTLSGLLIVISHLDWKLYPGYLHNCLGMIFTVLILFLVAGGVYALCL